MRLCWQKLGSLVRLAAAGAVACVVAATVCLPVAAKAEESDVAVAQVGISADELSGDEGALIAAAPAVSSVSYRPARPLVLVEGIDYVAGASGAGWYDPFGAGDTLSITAADGSVTTYTYDAAQEAFVNDTDPRDLIEPGGAEGLCICELDLAAATFTLTYRGASSAVAVTLAPNPVAAISFEPAEPLVFAKDGAESRTINQPDGEGNPTGATTTIYTHRFIQGDVLTVTTSEGVAVPYVYDVAAARFVSTTDPADTIDPGEVCHVIDDVRISWDIGRHDYLLEYAGRRCRVDAEVVGNPVASIAYLPAGGTRLVAGADTLASTWDPVGKVACRPWQRYYLRQRPGDKLLVTDPEGAVTAYALTEVDDGTVAYVSEFDSRDAIPAGAVSFSEVEPQSPGHPWTEGTHAFEVAYAGARGRVEVTIVANDVKALAFTPKTAYTLVDGRDTYWASVQVGGVSKTVAAYHAPAFAAGDALTVTAADGTLRTYVYAPDASGFANTKDASDVVPAVLVSMSDCLLVHEASGGKTAREFTLHYQGRWRAVPFIVGAGFFQDVTIATSHADDIWWLADEKISEGWREKDGTRTFRPNTQVKRGDLAAFLFRLARRWGMVDDSWQPKASTWRAFVDVSSTTSHAREIWWMAELGISTGWKLPGGAEFRPNDPVTRGQMAAFLYRLADMAGRGTGEAGDSSAFVDVTPATSFSDEIAWLAATGISTGWTEANGTRTYRPKDSVKRGDMAAFLHRLDRLGV